jgi:hypothetical protein
MKENIFGSRTDNVDGNRSEIHYKNLVNQGSCHKNLYFSWNYVPGEAWTHRIYEPCKQ